MKINVGSKNPTKIQAVKNLIKGHPLFEDAEVIAVDANVEEFGHPKNLQETIDGAKARAKTVFKNCTYSIGIEGGLMEVPETKSGYMEVGVCAIYDGKNYHLGTSPGFEWPQKVVDLILHGTDGSQAFKDLGLTSHPKIGVAEGAISILSQSKMSRTKYNEIALTMALIHLENPELY